MKKGIFISFEGGEGCGKDTQIKLLEQYFEKNNYEYVSSREPGGVLIGEEIRKLLLDAKYEKSPLTQVLLFEASRNEYVDKIVKPAIESGKIFISNRFFDSTTVYQGYAGNVNRYLINFLNNAVAKTFVPDLTFYLDIEPRIGLERAAKAKSEFITGDFFEKKNIEFHERLRKGFNELVNLHPERIKKIDGSNSINEVHEAIVFYLEKFLRNHSE